MQLMCSKDCASKIASSQYWGLGVWLGLCTLADDNFSTFHHSRSYVLARRKHILHSELREFPVAGVDVNSLIWKCPQLVSQAGLHLHTPTCLVSLQILNVQCQSPSRQRSQKQLGTTAHGSATYSTKFDAQRPLNPAR
jgi:hypothetical protein